MIGSIYGTLLHKSTSYLLIETAGVGYRVFTTPDHFEHPLGEMIRLYTYHRSTDDGQALYGFSEMKSLDFFELLLTVTGVGPKVALGILSAAKPDVLASAIASADAALFTRMGGVGKKTAERIILELKNKVGVLSSEGGSATTDIYDALVALGYSPREARDASTGVDTTATLEVQLKQALQILKK